MKKSFIIKTVIFITLFATGCNKNENTMSNFDFTEKSYLENTYAEIKMPEYNKELVNFNGDEIRLTINENIVQEIIPNDSLFRVVLSWGVRPKNLDLSVAGKLDSGEEFFINGNNMIYEYDGRMISKMQVDDNNCFGPETLDIQAPILGEYVVGITDMTNFDNPNSTELSNSNATINIYENEKKVATLFVPKNLNGNFWEACRIDKNGMVIPTNCIYQLSDLSQNSINNFNLLRKNMWVKFANNYYYMDRNSNFVTNKKIGDLYVGDDGRLIVNKLSPNGEFINRCGRIIDLSSDFNSSDKSDLKENAWFKTKNGIWYFFETNKKSKKTGWHFEERDNQWYYLNPVTGAMVTGWNNIDGKYYYFEEQYSIEPNWYYVQNTDKWESYGKNVKSYGSMYRDEITPDGHKVDRDGILIR